MTNIRVVTAKEMARIEGMAYAAGFQELDFMENAGTAVACIVDQFIQINHLSGAVTLLVGKGNNGGDAYVAGVKLLEKGYAVNACHIYSLDQCGPLCRQQCERFEKAGGKIHFVHKQHEIIFPKEGLILDGLVGTGFKGKAEGALAESIEMANASSLPIVSIDIPSGVCGNTGKVGSVAIHACLTIYLELPKLGFFLEQGWAHTGQLVMAQFGLPESFVQEAQAEAYLASDKKADLLPRITKSRHKYEAGYVLAIAGSPTMAGAGILSCESALRSGAGLIRWFYPQGMETLISSAPWEIMKEPWDGKDFRRIFDESKKATAYLIGPGLGRDHRIKKVLKRFFNQCDRPCVIDADALYFLSQHPRMDLPKDCLLTPHVGEMKRLLSTFSLDQEEENWLVRCQKYAEEKKTTVLVKGSPNFLFAPDTLPQIMPFGNPGMATAGSGDVLTGVLAGLVAQGMSPVKAAELGCFLHGLAGDIAAEKQTYYSMTATDILNSLPQAFAKLQSQSLRFSFPS
jgi:ADP-dependent NAD(P)H-hydrate dehydratase / NAD(P)H-hydrate epimerase